MNYDVTYSLRVALENEVPELNDVVLMRDGVTLTGRPKPFATVQYLQGGGDLVSAGRTSYVDTYRFQIGVFANDVSELHRLETKIRNDVIREPYGHDLYVFNEVTGVFDLTTDTFTLSDDGFTPISNDDSSDETYANHGYFDVASVFY
jgi:hypothetical protein